MVKKSNAVVKKLADHGFCCIRQDQDTFENGLFSNLDFQPADVLVDFFAADTQEEPDYLTIQIGERRHIHLFPEYLQFVNHSCSPNVLFNTTNMKLECISPISAGDELRFFYPATEWVMSKPFICKCGSSDCIGQISGAADLPISTLGKYRLTDFVGSMLAKRI